MSKLRTLLLLHELSLSGAPKVALDAFQILRDEVDLRIVSYAGGPFEARCRTIAPLEIMLPPVPGRASSLREQMRYGAQRVASQAKWPRIAKGVQKFNPDVIYVNSVAALPAVRRLKLPELLPDVPAILHVHELESHLREVASDGDLLRQWPRKLIAVSEAVRHALTQDYGVADEKIALIHEFAPEIEPLPAPREDDVFVVGGAGSIAWRKGVELWLLMAAELRALMGDRVRFVWVGLTGDARGWEVQEMARKLDLEQCVEWVPQTLEPLKHFARFDAFAMTSWEDPCPIVVIEAMMMEKPVVCFANSGGAPEEIGETGITIEKFSPQLMAQALATLAADTPRRAALAKATRQRALEHFSAASQVPKIRDELQRAVSA
jgi:glycosyltransferase involved in cell wall biosynthesis